MDTVQVDSGLTTFDFGEGRTLVVDSFKLQRQLNDVAKEAFKDETLTHFDYLDRIIAFVKQTYSIDIEDRHAEWLNAKLMAYNTEKKRAWLAPLNALAGSPGVTASTASPPED